MLFAQQSPPDTSVYMIAGYAVILGVMLLYLLSLYLRRRNLQQDLKALREIEAVTNANATP